jgi:hypothetical protein
MIVVAYCAMQFHRNWPMFEKSTAETSVNFYQTARRNIPEDSHLHTRKWLNFVAVLLC